MTLICFKNRRNYFKLLLLRSKNDITIKIMNIEKKKKKKEKRVTGLNGPIMGPLLHLIFTLSFIFLLTKITYLTLKLYIYIY